jgi:TPP-dependent pyruvate/acetoin dehydrogenase alpha subunit
VQRAKSRIIAALSRVATRSCTGFFTILLKTIHDSTLLLLRYNCPKDMSTKSAKKAPSEQTFSLISNAKLQHLYATMLKCRMLGAHAPKGKGKSFWKGKEGATVAATIDLQPQDALVLPSAPLLAGFLRGASLPALFRQAQESASAKGKLKRADAASAEGALATGIAYAHYAQKSESVTVALLSENPEADDTGYHSLIFANAQKLPVIYLYNGDAADLTRMHSYGFPVVPVDGNDVVAVYRVMFECTVRARQGKGPSLLACQFFSANKGTAASNDPIRNMENYLASKGLFEKELKPRIMLAFEKELARSLGTAKKSAPQNEDGKIPQYTFTL